MCSRERILLHAQLFGGPFDEYAALPTRRVSLSHLHATDDLAVVTLHLASRERTPRQRGAHNRPLTLAARWALVFPDVL